MPIKIFRASCFCLSTAVVCLGSGVWDKQRHDFRCSPRESNFNSSCRGPRNPWHWLISCPCRACQLQGLEKSPPNRVAGVSLEKQKHWNWWSHRMRIAQNKVGETCHGPYFQRLSLGLAFSLFWLSALFYSLAPSGSPFHRLSKYLLSPTVCQTWC